MMKNLFKKFRSLVKDHTAFIIKDEFAEIDFDYSNGLISFNLNIDGENFLTEFNSCTFPNRINENKSKKNGWKRAYRPSPNGIIGSEPISIAEIPKFMISSMEVYKLYCVASLIEGINAPDLILGSRILEKVIVEVDYRIKKIRFYSPANWKKPEKTPSTLIYNLEMAEKVIPVIKNDIILNDKLTVNYGMVDSGNNGAILISPNIAEELGIVEGRENVQTIITGEKDNIVKLLYSTLDNIIIEGLELNDVPVYTRLDKSNPIINNPYWINIGNGILGNFKVTWALPYNQFVLQYS